MKITRQHRLALNKLANLIKPYYKEKHRVYHTWNHISHLLYRWHDSEVMRKRLRPYFAYEELAILFHDIVYIPGSYENEEQSVLLMKTILGNNRKIADVFSPVDIEKAEAIILDTKYPHIPTHDFSKYVVDMDMLGFTATYSVFFEISNKIESEFKSVPDMKEKRKKFLTQLLTDRNPFYFSPEFKPLTIKLNNSIVSLTDKARYNITMLLENQYGGVGK